MRVIQLGGATKYSLTEKGKRFLRGEISIPRSLEVEGENVLKETGEPIRIDEV
jgi:hypothetical protein